MPSKYIPSATTKKPKDKTVVMIAVGKLKAKKNGTKRRNNRRQNKCCG